MQLETSMSTETVVVDRIQRAFEELRTHQTLISNCSLLWKDLSDHYSSLEKTLAERSQSLESKLEALEFETQQALESIERQDSSLPHRESSAAALIEGRRAAVIAEIEDPASRPPSSLHGLLRWYIRRMESAGLWRFMMSRRKELEVLRREISEAVSECIDPARLVLDAVEDFLNHPDAVATDADGEGSWAVGVLVRTLSEFEGKKASEMPQSIRDRAAVVAESWRAKHAGKKGNTETKEAGGGVGDKGEMEGAEARTFLRMVIAFELRSRYEVDFLVKLVIEKVPKKELAMVASRLRFNGKIEDIVRLVSNGKEIEAIYFAYESGLSEKFSPVPLLKSHLQNSRKYANSILRKKNHSAFATEESNNLELNALKSIVKCVETLNLEQKFTIDTLKKRILELENATPARKRFPAPIKPQTKRTPHGGPPNLRPIKSARTSNASYACYTRYLAQVRSPSMTQQFNAAEPISGTRSTMPNGGPPINYGEYNHPAATPPPPYSQ